MLRLLAVSIGITLMSVIPVGAEQTISVSPKELQELQKMAASGKQGAIIGYLSRRVGPDGRWDVVPLYASPDRSSNIVGVTADGEVVFCFCGRTTF